MAGIHPQPKEFEEPKPETVTPTPDLSVHVLDSAIKRGLNTHLYDTVKTIFLWPGHYRINCHKNHKITDSYFVRYSDAEGILFSIPNLPVDNESIEKDLVINKIVSQISRGKDGPKN